MKNCGILIFMLLINIDHFASTHIKYEYSQAKSACLKNAFCPRGAKPTSAGSKEKRSSIQHNRQ